MKENKYLLNILFTLTLTAALLGGMVLRLCCPQVILPLWNIPNLTLLSLIPAVLHWYLTHKCRQCWPVVALLAAASCALLPWCCGWIVPGEILSYALSGGVVFTAVSALFASITDRLSTGPAGKLAPILGAIGLYLASQCFQGILI